MTHVTLQERFIAEELYLIYNWVREGEVPLGTLMCFGMKHEDEMPFNGMILPVV